MRVALCIAVIFIIIALPSSTQSKAPADDFSLTLERIGCLGSCPDYKVTIQSDGTLQYEGRAYVHVEGVRKKKLPLGVVQRLAQRLQEEDFLHWEEKKSVCIDFPETHITATLNGVRKRVMEGCNAPGKVLKLANEIERITGIKRWI
jgi:hypothetical protein